jgi:hypothetical protein
VKIKDNFEVWCHIYLPVSKWVAQQSYSALRGKAYMAACPNINTSEYFGSIIGGEMLVLMGDISRSIRTLFVVVEILNTLNERRWRPFSTVIAILAFSQC